MKVNWRGDLAPVVTVSPFDGFDMALRMVNESPTVSSGRLHAGGRGGVDGLRRGFKLVA